MKELTLKQLDSAFEIGAVKRIGVIGEEVRSWYPTFETDDPVTGTQIFTLARQRLGKRTWSDPRKLFSWLRTRYGVTAGEFKLFFDE